MTITKSIKQDEKYIWHPFTQHKISPLPIKIVSGKMTKLKDEKGNSYIDLISSWRASVFSSLNIRHSLIPFGSGKTASAYYISPYSPTELSPGFYLKSYI